MSKKILVNNDEDQIRIAITEEDKFVEYYEENADSARIAGNIYKGRVRNILPGMQSAFIDVGLEKDVFLHINDVYFEEEEQTGLIDEVIDEDRSKSEETLQEKGIFIENLLSKGQEIIVQIIKEPIGNKGPRGTTLITLPGRYIVLMPNQKHIGVSRRIQDEDEKERLKEIGHKICPENMGIIMRTVSKGKSFNDFEEDITFLLKLWSKIDKKIQQASTPELIYSDLEPVLKMVRDLFSDNVEELLVDTKIDFDRINDFFDFLPEKMLKRINYYCEVSPIFEKFGIEREISRLLNKNVGLKCGGYIVIEKTEALTAIDVNTGSFVGKTSDLEKTVFRTNMEAAKEISRQLRLRDIGGIIILDFIDMLREENKKLVVEELKKECEKDKMPITICDLSEFGLVEMTRKRVRKSLLGQVTQPCSYCKGKGFVLSPQEISSKVRREIRRHARKITKNNILVSVHPEVGFYLIGEDEKNLSRMEAETQKKIYIRTEKDFHIENFVIS
ncbi:MAG: Rne/Rng family ribonuclease [Candidatus Muiribacteriota bacterium]